MSQKSLRNNADIAVRNAGEMLKKGLYEDAVREYAQIISSSPDTMQRYMFNLTLARRRFRKHRKNARNTDIFLCGFAPANDLNEIFQGYTEHVTLVGLRPDNEVQSNHAMLDMRLPFGAFADLRARVFAFVLQNPCDVVTVADTHFSTVVFALFYQFVWGTEIRSVAPVAFASTIDLEKRFAEIPRLESGAPDFLPAHHRQWSRILEGFPIAAAADCWAGSGVESDKPRLALFELLGGWHGLAIRPETADFLQLTTVFVQDLTLHIAGIVVHPDYPGLPVRLEVITGRKVIAATVARVPDKKNLLSANGTGLHFDLSMPFPESAIRAPLTLRVIGTGRAIEQQVAIKRKVIQQPSAAALMSPVLIPPDAEIIGNVEAYTRDSIRGWAMCPSIPDATVELIMYCDGNPCAYSRTSSYKENVGKGNGRSGYYGFVFDIPSNLVVGAEAVIEVRSITGQSKIKNSKSRISMPPGMTESGSLEAPRQYNTSSGPSRPDRISVIILNRNGSGLLRDMFESCSSEDLSENTEWIVVDHDSTDDSAAVCTAFSLRGGNIQFLRRRGNYSFSESNNFGVRYATGEILVFANNDLIFREAFGERLRDYMSDPAIGALGVRLLDYVDAPAPEITQHLGVFFKKFLNGNDWIRPYEARSGQETNAQTTATRAICVTGAFLAMNRMDFETVGGFDEAYSYGLEDVDICLKVHELLNKDVVCANDIAIVHHRGFSRKQDNHAAIRRRRNNEVFNRRWGNWLRMRIRENMLSDPAVITGSRPVIGFVCTDVSQQASAGEYVTALEMGRALQGIIPCHARYIPEKEWYDLTGVDVLIVMAERFDLKKIVKASPWLTTVNWMRNEFDGWASHPETSAYDFLFASSGAAARYIEDHVARPVGLLPDAARKQVCEDEPAPEALLRSDYCFIGDRSDLPRELEFQLDPTAISGSGKVFGSNWDKTQFGSISAGAIPDADVPTAYASTKIVLDDSNIAANTMGSCSSQVFDAMAAGCLLMTNNVVGVQDIFGDLVPTFDSRESLTTQLHHWLGDDAMRTARIQQMQKIVREDHTYSVRAHTLLDWMSKTGGKTRIAIKCPAKYSNRLQWGDFHYAESLAAALRRLGHVVRVDCRETWNSGITDSDDVVIVLRGLEVYKPRPHQCNIMWLISHPHAVSVAEMAKFDHVFVASQLHADILTRDFGLSASFLPQCTDTSRFHLNKPHLGGKPERNLYVANSRGVFRDPVRWAIQNELPMDIYGSNWESFITDNRYRGKLVPNEVLSEFYGSSKLVICDHWEDMRHLGYVSNRLFDVLASGGRLVIDRVAGLLDLVPEKFVTIYDTEQDFVSILRDGIPIDHDLRIEAGQWAAKHHSFDARARDISDRVHLCLSAAHRGIVPQDFPRGSGRNVRQPAIG